jgi:GR25 family glycosyltransferase involved in LPS biosynthesis
MKSFIIRLSDYSNSVKWAEQTYSSALNYGWNINYFEGINGINTSLEEHNLFVNLKHKKSKTSFLRPGTLGCFLSHYYLWKKAIELNEPICILEHDAVVHTSFPKIEFQDVYKFVIGFQAKPIYIGQWWASGAGYCVSPQGARKLINFSQTNGVMPNDVMINNGIVDIKFDNQNIVTVKKQNFSFTWDLTK